MPVSIPALKVQFEKQVFNTNQFKGLALGIAQRRVNLAQIDMLETFEGNSVTKEIEGGVDYNGPSIINYHSTEGQANLFSFIGFPAGSNPVDVLRKLLEFPIRVQLATRNKNAYYFRVLSPTVKDVEDATPMPDDYLSGNFSWARGIEDGDLLGIGQYLAIETSASRSGKGIQIRFGNVNNSIETVPYITEILEAFRKRLEEIS